MPRLPVRIHLLILTAAAVVPVWLFAAYLLAQYAMNERVRFERDAIQVARQVSLAVEGELTNLRTVLAGLAKSSVLMSGDLKTLHAEALRVVDGSDRIIILRDLDRRQILNTQLPYGAPLPPAVPLETSDVVKINDNQPTTSDVYASPITGEYRVAVALPVSGPKGERWLLALSVPTARIRDVITKAAPADWTVAVGDRNGAYVARSKLHEDLTGKPGLPEYVNQIVGHSGTFTSRNFQNITLLAGYVRPDLDGWFYTANVPLSIVQAPLWNSLHAIGAIGLAALLLSLALSYVVGANFAKAAAGVSARARALGSGERVTPIETSVAEFAEIGDSLIASDRALAERTNELKTVLETAPVAVWFTYDPSAREVIRNRFAAELMGLPTDTGKSFGTPDLVIDTIARKDGQMVSREDRPLSRAMRGELTDNEEFAYVLLNGAERILLTSARPIRDGAGKIVGAVQISLDITDRKRGEEQRKLLVKELNHRVKNTLAVVQSISIQTLRSAASLQEAGPTLTKRLISLAKAHDILTQENWTGADLKDLVPTSLASHASLERFHISGGSIRLPPNLTLSLALALHELSTNAIKYGALSTAGGTVSLSWFVEGGAKHQRLRIEWRETGGPVVAPPQTKGFGTRMIERLLDVEAGTVEIEFKPSGVLCVFEINLA